MYVNTTLVMPDGQISLSDDMLNELNLTVGDHVALIRDGNRIIMRKLTAVSGRMTFDEFLLYRDVKIKNPDHERIVRLFYVYSGSVTANNRLLPDILGHLLNIDTTSVTVPCSCFNGIYDGTEPPYEDVDLYVRFSNDIRVFIYGKLPKEPLKKLAVNEYVIFVLSDNLNSNIDRLSERQLRIIGEKEV